MSKKFSSRLLVASLLVAFCLVAGTWLPRASAQRGAAPAETRAAQNAALVSTTEAVLEETSEIRELSVLRQVKSGAQSRSQIERMIIKNLDTDTTPAEMHASEVLLKAFGLAPARFAYRPFLIKLLTEQVAGYYDPKAQQFYLADWIEIDGQKLARQVLAQDQPGQFFDVEYPIPAALIRGKSTVRVRFAPPPKNTAGPVFGVRVFTEKE